MNKEVLQDEWVTIEEAKEILLVYEDVHRVDIEINSSGKFLCTLNNFGLALKKYRIFTGEEHILAEKDMLIKHSLVRKHSNV